MNVLGDSFGAAIVSHFSQNELQDNEVPEDTKTTRSSVMNSNETITIDERM